MPIVQATDVPYGAATLGGLPQTSVVPPDAFQRIPTEPAQFGALQGMALEKTGGQLEQAGSQFAARTIEAQNLHNQVSAHEAANNTQDQSINLLDGGPDNPGYFALKGRNALDAYPTTRDQLVKLYADARQNLQNPHQQLIYDNETRSALRWQLTRMSEHYNTQQQFFGKETNKATYDLAKQNLVAHADDPAASALAIGNMMKSRVRDVELAGGGADQVSAALGAVRTEATVTMIQSLGNKDPAAARTMLEEADNRNLIPPHIYKVLDDELRSGAITSDVASMFLGGPTKPPAGGPVGPAQQGTVTSGKVAAAAIADNVDPALANGILGIESKHGAVAGSPTKKYAGLYQLGEDERVEAGGSRTSIGSLDDQLRQGIRIIRNRRTQLIDELGRTPENWEVYMAHQQGIPGLKRLINNPNTLIKDLPGDGPINAESNPANATKAQVANMTSQQYLALWRDRYNREEAQFKGVTPEAPGAPRTQVAESSGPSTPPVPQAPSGAGGSEGPPTQVGPATLTPPVAAETPPPTVPSAVPSTIPPGAPPTPPPQPTAVPPVRDVQADLARLRAMYPNPKDFAAAVTAYEHLNSVANSAAHQKHQAELDLSEAASKDYMSRIGKGDFAGVLTDIPNDRRLTSEAMRVLTGAANAEKNREADKFEKTHGTGFWDIWKRMFLPLGDPNRISDPYQVLKMADSSNYLTLSGAKEIAGILESKKTPEGQADAEMVNQMFKASHQALAGEDPMLPFLKDPRGETQQLKFMQAALPEIMRLKAEGKLTMAEITDLEKGPLAKTMNSFKRTQAQINADRNAAKNQGQPPVIAPPVSGAPAPGTDRGRGRPAPGSSINYDANGNPVEQP